MLYVQKAVRSLQTVQGLQGPGVTDPTIASLDPPPERRTAMTWTSQRPGRADSVRRSSRRSFHD